MRTVILLIFFGVVAILLLPVIVLCAVFKWAAPIIGVGKWAVKVGRRLVGVRLHVEGLSGLDRNRACIYMPNHLSMLDAPLLYMLIPGFARAIAKKEIFRVPILGQGMHVVEFIPVDRKGRSGGRRAIEKAAALIREKGYSFMVFPEGTRSRDGRLQEFRRGGFFLALQSGVPIVPVSISGTFPLLPRGRFTIKRGRVNIRFHDAVPVDGYDQDSLHELIARVREAVRSGLAGGSDTRIVGAGVAPGG